MGRLDIVRLDVLLWALGGFALAPEDSAAPARRAIIALARGPYRQFGKSAQLAERFGMTPNYVSVLVHHARRGTLPAYWNEGGGARRARPRLGIRTDLASEPRRDHRDGAQA